MNVEQIYTNCPAEAAYYIESEGEAAIIDPLRETKPYTSGLTPPPLHVPKDALLNKMGCKSVDEVICKGMQALSPNAFALDASEENALILDVRSAQEFGQGFIPNSINIGLEGQFADWVGSLIPDLSQPILLVVPDEQAEEAVLQLARVGYDNCIGYLKGGFAAWQAVHRDIDTITSISADAFVDVFQQNPLLPMLDVRRKAEYDVEHIAGADNLSLESIYENLASLNPENTYYVYCADGYRSMIALSVLKAHGFTNLINVTDGFTVLRKTGQLPLKNSLSLTTLH